MFNKTEVGKEKQELTESCTICKHLVLKKDMKEVKWVSIAMGWYSEGIYLYCPEHKPNYDRTYTRIDCTYQCFREMEVSKDGEPVGYIKIARKNDKK